MTALPCQGLRDAVTRAERALNDAAGAATPKALAELSATLDEAQVRLAGATAQLSLFERTRITPAEVAHVIEYGPIVFASDDGAVLYTINGSYLNRWRRTSKGWDCEDCQATNNGSNGLYGMPIDVAMEKAERWHREGNVRDEDDTPPAPVAAPPPPHAPRPARGKAETPPTFERTLTLRQRELLERFVIADNLARFDGSDHLPDWPEVKRVFVALGARWAKGAFRFADDVDGATKVRMAIDTGAILDPRLAGFFPTPDDLARRVAELAVRPGDRVLEPSAGSGQLVRAARAAGAARIDAIEAIEPMAIALEDVADTVVFGRFQDQAPAPIYGAVVMNPPFSSDDEGDIGHVLHALTMLKPGGRLAAILSAGARYRSNARHESFRWRVEQLGATWEDLPPGTFAESGTNVATCLLSVRVP